METERLVVLYWRLLQCENILFKEVLLDKFLKISPETFAVGDLVSLVFVKRTILSRSRKCGVMLDRLQPSYPRLVLNGTEDVIYGEPQQGEVCAPL